MSRCWMPSCRSRSIRFRTSSAATTIRAREAISSALLSAFAMAVATSVVNSARRNSVSGGSGSGLVDPAAITPQRRPSTMMGTPTADWTPACCMGCDNGPAAVA
jgi:hypothetical protein